MSNEPRTHMKAGLAYGLAAYLAWGFFPVYFKQVKTVPAIEVLGHRIVWSVLFLAVVLMLQQGWAQIAACLRSRRTLLWLLGSTVAIAINWLVFIWAVGKGFVLESSLGYFINPLVNVLLGFLFLRERLRPWQIAGVLLATLGVANLAIHQGHVPWIALTLAASFGFYGLLRKTAHVPPLEGLVVETTLLLPVGFYFVIAGLYRYWTSPGTLDLHAYKWLPLSGVLTAVPLLWFAAAAKRLRLSTMGFLQYITPTGQFLLAVFLYGELFTPAHRTSFACIWIALLIYSIDSLRAYRSLRSQETIAALAPEG